MSGNIKGCYPIELLNKNNYDTWKIQAEAVLIKCKLWQYVLEKIKAPEDVKGKEDYDEKVALAKSELILMISPNEIKIIRNCKTAIDIWNKLKEIYESEGPARKASLLKQLILTKCLQNDNMRDHLDKFEDIVDKLKNMEVDINGDLLTIIMLYSLPTNFENFRIAIESRDKLPTPDEHKIKILEEYESRQQNAEENESEALSKKQRTIALSTAEAEYMSLTEASKEALYLKNLLNDLNISFAPNTPITIKCDNQAAIKLAMNPVVNAKSKHIDIKLHFIREVISNGNVKLEYIPTENNISDMLTKALNNTKQSSIMKQINMCNVTVL